MVIVNTKLMIEENQRNREQLELGSDRIEINLDDFELGEIEDDWGDAD